MVCEPVDRQLYSLYFSPWIILSFLFVVGWSAILIFVIRRGT